MIELLFVTQAINRNFDLMIGLLFGKVWFSHVLLY